MDVSKFTEEKTGVLVPIEVPEKDFAFIPDPIPMDWRFDPSLWPLLVEARSALSLLNGRAQTLPHPKLLLTPLQRVESLTSSRLEGTYATAQEMMLFELESKEHQDSSDQTAWIEVNNYNRALAEGFAELKKLPLCFRLIKSLHSTLLTGVRGRNKRPGEFRNHQVHLGSNRRYIPPPFQKMEACMDELEKYVNTPTDYCDPLVRSFLVHYQFEAIHPFSDGNGRIGRVLLSLMIYKWCDLNMPWLYLSPYFDRYKEEYIDNMFNISAQGKWSKWIEFCLRGTTQQAKSAVKKCDELLALKKRMDAKITDGSHRMHAIIEGLFESPFVRVADLSKKLKVAYQTTKLDLESLVSKDILRPLDNQKVKTFYAPEIFELAYGDSE